MLLDVSPFVPILPVKVCITCGEVKPHSAFSKTRAKSDGLCPICKECDHKRRRARYAAHAEEEREAKRQYYAENRDELLAQKRADRAANPEKYRERDRKRLARPVNREKKRERARKYYAADPEKHRRQARESQARHKERRSAYNRQYRTANAEKLKEYVRSYQKEWGHSDRGKEVRRAIKLRYRARKSGLLDNFTPADWQYALDYFGGCCAACGRQPGLWHTLAADHWIPLASSDCPGTVAWNIVPLCHGNDGCNNQKFSNNPADWLIEKFGPRKGRAILRKIEAFLESRKPDTEATA